PQLLQVPEGEYNLNILVRYLKDHYMEYHLVPAAGDGVNNPVKVRMTHPVRTQDVRLYKAIDLPATMSSSEAYTLEVEYTLLARENNPSEDIFYQFNSAIVFTPLGGGAEYEVGKLGYLAAVITGGQNPWHYGCDLSQLPAGDYEVTVIISDGYDVTKGRLTPGGISADIPNKYYVTVTA
ncbi:MAG: hypothetical protein ACRCSI_13405, partial [Eubacterium aggregans]